MENINLENVWPEWKIVRQLGRGSYGTVYEAIRIDHSIESHTAIKVITIPQSESEISSLRSEGLTEGATRTYLQGVVNDFVLEIQMMISFKGLQNIVSVEDFKVVERTDRVGWDIYIRMELLQPFNEYLVKRRMHISEKEVLKLGIDICTALELCSSKNVIHRDVKPENIFVNNFGNFKLGDFGIARTMENTTNGLSHKGTYSYMAPEIERGSNYDATVDLYSLGLVLYRLMNNNRQPFLFTEEQVMNPNERMIANRRRLNGESLPVPEMARPEFADVILRACAYDPAKRYRDATEMKAALMQLSKRFSGQNASAGRPIRQSGNTVPTNRNQQAGPVVASGQNINETVRVRRPEGNSGPVNNRMGHPPVSEPPQWNNSAPNKKPVKGIILAAILAIVLITGGVLLGSVLSHKSNEEDHTDSSSVSVSSESEEEVVEASSSVSEEPEEPAEEESTDWQTAYVDYYNDALKNSPTDITGFMLFDADGDEIPELLIWYAEHSPIGLVSWYDGKIIENGLGEYCSTIDGVSGITYYPKGKEIYSCPIAPWSTGDPVLSVLKDGKLERVNKVQSEKNAVNYTKTDAYQPTSKNFEKHVKQWSPETAFAGSKPVKPTPTKKATATPKPATSSKPTPAPQQPSIASGTTLYILNPNDGLTLRDQPDYFAGGKIFEIHGTTPLTYLGQSQPGYGSDSAIHDWYMVQISDVYGWVRSDLITQVDGGYYVASDPTGMNMRSSSNINSPIAGTLYGGDRIELTGTTGQGLGSDGVIHTWYYVRLVDTLTGWVRGDLTTG